MTLRSTRGTFHDDVMTGDLTDCDTIVAVEGEGAGAGEHRIVVRDVGDGGVEVSEVSAVEDRTGDLPYLLAGLCLGRLEDPVRSSDAQRRVDRIRQSRRPHPAVARPMSKSTTHWRHRRKPGASIRRSR